MRHRLRVRTWSSGHFPLRLLRLCCGVVVVVLVALLCDVGHVHASGSFQLAAPESVEAGQELYDRLVTNAGKESFLQRLFRTDCYSRALASLNKDCRSLSDPERTKLALLMLNCFLANTLGRQVLCTASMTPQQCTRQLDNQTFPAFTVFFSNVHTLCVFTQNRDFQQQAEALVQQMHQAAAAAGAQLEAVQGNLTEQSGRLHIMQAVLGSVAEQQGSLLDSVERGLEQVQDLSLQSQQLQQQMDASLQHSRELQALQHSLSSGLREMEQEGRQAAEAAQSRWEGMELQARSMEQRQTRYELLQSQLLSSSEALAQQSSKLQGAMDLVLSYQRSSQAALSYIMGRSCSLADVLQYLGSTAALLLMGAVPHRGVQAAVPQLLLLLLMTLATERLAGSYLLPWLLDSFPFATPPDMRPQGAEEAFPAGAPWGGPPAPGVGRVLALAGMRVVVRRSALLLAVVVLLVNVFREWKQQLQQADVLRLLHTSVLTIQEQQAFLLEQLRPSPSQHSGLKDRPRPPDAPRFDELQFCPGDGRPTAAHWKGPPAAQGPGSDAHLIHWTGPTGPGPAVGHGRPTQGPGGEAHLVHWTGPGRAVKLLAASGDNVGGGGYTVGEAAHPAYAQPGPPAVTACTQSSRGPSLSSPPHSARPAGPHYLHCLGSPRPEQEPRPELVPASSSPQAQADGRPTACHEPRMHEDGPSRHGCGPGSMAWSAAAAAGELGVGAAGASGAVEAGALQASEAGLEESKQTEGQGGRLGRKRGHARTGVACSEEEGWEAAADEGRVMKKR